MIIKKGHDWWLITFLIFATQACDNHNNGQQVLEDNEAEIEEQKPGASGPKGLMPDPSSNPNPMPRSNPPPNPTPNPNPDPTPNSNPNSNPPPTSKPAGYKLFETTLTATEQSDRRKSFLKANKVEKIGSFIRYHINTSRGLDRQLNIPVIHTYHNVGAAVPLAVALSEDFKWNIPQAIRDQISSHDVEKLDIFFAPQKEVRDADASLKPAYWMFPNRPKIVVGSPPEYSKTVLLGIFDSDYVIDDQVKNNELKPFSVILHDNLVSPNTGHVNISAAPAGSFAFYSLAIFEEQKRVAVTLHWIMTEQDKEELEKLLLPNKDKSFSKLLKAINASHTFKGTSLISKLNGLVKL